MRTRCFPRGARAASRDSARCGWRSSRTGSRDRRRARHRLKDVLGIVLAEPEAAYGNRVDIAREPIDELMPRLRLARAAAMDELGVAELRRHRVGRNGMVSQLGRTKFSLIPLPSPARLTTHSPRRRVDFIWRRVSSYSADQLLLMSYGASEEPRRQRQQSRFQLPRSASSPKRPPRHTHPGLVAWDGDPSDAVSFPSAQVPRLRSHSRRAQPAPSGHPYIGSSQLPSPWDQSPCRSDLTQERLCEP
jgi:hypothetical protein